MPTVSVCMATYNGASYLREQLDSILAQLREGDELVIVDDASSDETLAVLAEYEDSRIRVFPRAHNLGYVATFEEAMGRATGDVLLLADQDDVWIPGRRDVLVQAVQERAVAASNLVVLGTGAPLPSPIRRVPWALRARDSNARLRNEARILAGIIPYFGCAMAIRRDALERILPFPGFIVESHDLWIATVANRHGILVHVEAPTLQRRLHGENASASRPRGLRAVLAARWMLLRALWAAGRR